MTHTTHHLIAYDRLPLLVLATILAGVIGGGLLAQNEPQTSVRDLPCAPLTAYLADLTAFHAGNTLTFPRTRDETDVARGALTACLATHGLASSAP